MLTKQLPANAQGLIALETYEYDRNSAGAACAGRGLVTKITHADNTYQAFGYDQFGNKLWEENELRQRTSYTYDAYNRVLTSTRIMNPDPNETITYTYAPSNGSNTSPFVQTTSNPDTIKTPTGIITKIDYDENLRKISATVASATTRFAYDSVGNLTSVTDPLSHVTATTYDNRNRKQTVTEASGTGLAITTTYTYDGASNITQIQRPDQTTETKTYDALNRVLIDTVPQTSLVNLPTKFYYNPSGTIQKIVDPNSHWTTFGYDPSDRKIEMTYQNGDTQSWTWDDAGNPASRTTVWNETQTFGYDNRNRKHTMVWSDAAEWSYLTYDAVGRLATAQNGYGSWNTNVVSIVTRSYDSAGRLTLDRQNVTGLGSKDVNYEYDLDGKPTRLYVSSGVSGWTYDYTFSYDAMGRFEKILATGHGAYFQYSYDSASNETQRLNLLNGIAQKYTRDALNRIAERDVLKGSTNLSYETYNRDAMSRVQVIGREGSNDDHFGYYQDGELNWATYGAGVPNNVNYVLDKAGNRTSISDGGTWKNYAPNVINQYTAAEGSPVTNGNEHEISSYQGVSYGYIDDEHLKSVSSTGNTYALAYDALGRCVTRTLNGLTTYYVYDGEKPIMEHNSTGNIVGWNIYGKGIDEILERGGWGSDNAWHWYYF